MAGVLLETPRLQLRYLTSNADGNVQLEYYHNVWRDKGATQWSPHGPCEDRKASQAWMAGVIPSGSTEGSEERVCCAVLLRQDCPIQKVADAVSTRDRGDGSESIGILTLLPATPIKEVLLDDPVLSDATHVIGLELGYLFLPSVWGNGFATESIQAFLEQHHSQATKSHPEARIQIQANVHPDNLGSLKVLDKLGFRSYETIIGDDVVFIGGASRNKSVVKLWKNL